MVGGELQVNNYSSWQMKNGGCLSRRTTDYRPRTTVVGFKGRTLVVRGLLLVNNHSGWLQMENSSGPRTENDSGELHIENYSNGLETESNSGRLQMENVR